MDNIYIFLPTCVVFFLNIDFNRNVFEGRGCAMKRGGGHAIEWRRGVDFLCFVFKIFFLCLFLVLLFLFKEGWRSETRLFLLFFLG